MDRERVIYQVPPYRGYVIPRQIPAHPRQIHTPFWKDPPRTHLDFMFDHDLPYHMPNFRNERMHGHPFYPNPYHDGGIFYLHNLWTKPSRPLIRHSYSQGQRGRLQNTAPIVDFPEMGHQNEEGHWEENVGVEEIDPERLREITSDTDDDLEHLESVSAVGENRQAEAAPESEYVALETIRRVKEQAREQAMRMKDHQSSETIEMADIDNRTQENLDRYDRPRRRDHDPTYQNKRQRVVHNPTATQKGGRKRFVGIHNRGWTPGGSDIPDGIIAGAHSTVSTQRLVSIPDTAQYATISELSDVQSSNEAPEPPNRPQARQSGEDRNLRKSQKNDKQKKYTLSAEPLRDRKDHDDTATCKRCICVFILVTSLLVILTLVGVILFFFFSPGLEDCREDIDCTRRSVLITGVVVAGCAVLCLLLSCCFWCLFVTYSHVINRRRAYPIHHHPSTRSMH